MAKTGRWFSDVVPVRVSDMGLLLTPCTYPPSCRVNIYVTHFAPHF